jgi:hypothetical protein
MENGGNAALTLSALAYPHPGPHSEEYALDPEEYALYSEEYAPCSKEHALRS